MNSMMSLFIPEIVTVACGCILQKIAERAVINRIIRSEEEACIQRKFDDAREKELDRVRKIAYDIEIEKRKGKWF